MKKLWALLSFRKVDQEAKVENFNTEGAQNDWIYPTQIFLNEVHSLTDRSGWSIEEWTLRDIGEFMKSIEQMGKAVMK